MEDSGRELTIGCPNSPPLARRCQKRGKTPRMLTGLCPQPDGTDRICQRWGFKQGINHRLHELTAIGPTLSETRKDAAYADRSDFQPDSTNRICQRWKVQAGNQPAAAKLTAIGPTLSETRSGAAHADRSVFQPKKNTQYLNISCSSRFR